MPFWIENKKEIDLTTDACESSKRMDFSLLNQEQTLAFDLVSTSTSAGEQLY